MLITQTGDSSLTNIEIVKFYLFSGDVRLLHFLIILMVIDIMTGLMKAFKNRNLWSRKSLFGFARKLMIFFIIVLANIADNILQLQGGLVLMTMLFYIGNEGLSIIENCAQMGVLIPKQIADKLAVIIDENEKKSFTTEIKEEFTTKHKKDLPGEKVEVKIEMQPEKIDKLKNGNKSNAAGPERWSNNG